MMLDSAILVKVLSRVVGRHLSIGADRADLWVRTRQFDDQTKFLDGVRFDGEEELRAAGSY